jgi:hypothetical protein
LEEALLIELALEPPNEVSQGYSENNMHRKRRFRHAWGFIAPPPGHFIHTLSYR